MVSDEPNPEDARKVAEHITNELPTGVKPIDANFDNKISLLGSRLTPAQVKPGESVKVEFFYRAQQVIARGVTV